MYKYNCICFEAMEARTPMHYTGWALLRQLPRFITNAADTKKAPEGWRLIGDHPRPNRPAPGAQKTLTAKPLVGYLRVNSVSQLHDWNGKTDTELPEKALASAYARPS